MLPLIIGSIAYAAEMSSWDSLCAVENPSQTAYSNPRPKGHRPPTWKDMKHDINRVEKVGHVTRPLQRGQQPKVAEDLAAQDAVVQSSSAVV